MAISSDVKNLDQVQYGTGIPKLLVALGVVVAFSAAFVANFPLERQVETLLKLQMAKIPGCRMSFESLRIEFLMPKVVLTDVNLPGSCLGGRQPLKMPEMALRFQGPSFAPLGVALRMDLNLPAAPLSLHYAAGLGSQVFNIQEEDLPLTVLSTLVPSMPKMKGHMKLNGKLALVGEQIQEMKVLLESQNLEILPQTVSDIKIPRLAIGNLLLKLESQGPRKLQVQEFIIGKADAPIRGKFSGTVDLAPGALSMSPVSLRGEAAMSDDFLQAFPILNLMLPQFAQKDGFYQINLGGTLGSLKPQP